MCTIIGAYIRPVCVYLGHRVVGTLINYRFRSLAPQDVAQPTGVTGPSNVYVILSAGGAEVQVTSRGPLPLPTFLPQDVAQR